MGEIETALADIGKKTLLADIEEALSFGEIVEEIDKGSLSSLSNQSPSAPSPSFYLLVHKIITLPLEHMNLSGGGSTNSTLTKSHKPVPVTFNIIQKNLPFATLHRQTVQSSLTRMNAPIFSRNIWSSVPSIISSDMSSEDCAGSATNPWTICVNISRLKRNLIFDIVYFKRIEHNGRACEGVYIWVKIGANHREFLLVWIDLIDKYPGTYIMTCGWSKSSAYDQVESYH